MGPSECISSTFQKYNGPKRSNRQQHPPIQWAHPNASAVPHRNLMGPSEVMGSRIANAMGPSECISSASQKSDGPKQSNQQQHPPMPWAHLSTSAAPSRNITGQRKVIGSSIR